MRVSPVITAKAKIIDKRANLKRRANDGAFRSLNHAAATIRKTAQYSIRRTKKTSKPGSPPNSPSGHLRRAIRYKASKPNDTEQVAEIGATNQFAQTIWDLHEHGGRGRRKRTLKLYKFQVGDYGPVRPRKNKLKTTFTRNYVFVKLETQAQADRARGLQRNENRMRGVDSPGLYPKRPFMGPALKKNEKRLPAFWRGSAR